MCMDGYNFIQIYTHTYVFMTKHIATRVRRMSKKWRREGVGKAFTQGMLERWKARKKGKGEKNCTALCYVGLLAYTKMLAYTTLTAGA